jgi:hypothetical protein
LAHAHYEHDGPEHKRAVGETEVLRQGGVAWVGGQAEADVEVEGVTPLEYPHPERLGAVSYTP